VEQSNINEFPKQLPLSENSFEKQFVRRDKRNIDTSSLMLNKKQSNKENSIFLSRSCYELNEVKSSWTSGSSNLKFLRDFKSFSGVNFNNILCAHFSFKGLLKAKL